MLTALSGSPTMYPAFTVPARLSPAAYAIAYVRNESTGATGLCRVESGGGASLNVTVALGNLVTVNLAFLAP